MYCCCFLGHKECSDNIKEILFDTIEKLITEENVNKFYVGTQGGFDKLVYNILSVLEKKYEIQIFVVLAYLERVPKNKYYDNEKTIFPDELTKTPFRFAISRRNSYMIKKSNYIITYINSPFSRAYNNIEEAIKKKKRIINLGDFHIESIVL